MQKVRLNYGKRGLKELPADYGADFYDYMLDLWTNGHRAEAIEVFNRMKSEVQKAFMIDAILYATYAMSEDNRQQAALYRSIVTFLIKNM